MFRKLLLLVLLFTLTGCSAPAVLALNTPTPLPTPTACVPLNSRGGDPNCTPVSITSAPPSLPTATKPPSSPTATMPPPSPTATLARSAQVIPIQPTPQPVETWSSTSPYGNWIAQGRAEFPATRGANATYHVQLQVARKDGSQTWTVMDQSLPYQSGYVKPEIFFWSQDGARFYFANLPHPDGCVLLYNARDLQRVDLATGRVQMIAPQVGFTYLALPVFLGDGVSRSIEGYTPALSQNETNLAYISDGQPLRVVLHDVAKGVEKQVPLQGPTQSQGWGTWSSDDSQAGAITWIPGAFGPNSHAMLLSVFDHPCNPTQRKSWIVMLEADGWENNPALPQAVLRHYDTWLMRVVRWISNNFADIEDGEGHRDGVNPKCPTGCTAR